MVKQVIVVRKDLDMGTGKLVAQACHACLSASEEARRHNFSLWKRWVAEGSKKIVVKVFSLEDLLKLDRDAKKLGVVEALIIDRGLTQIAPNTPTALGLGPAEDETLDPLTGNLKLL